MSSWFVKKNWGRPTVERKVGGKLEIGFNMIINAVNCV
jgi:hypothetical protein